MKKTAAKQRQKTQTGETIRRSLVSRVRILPLTILAVALLLGLKIGALWEGRGELFVTAAGAQQATGQPMPVTPRQAPAETARPQQLAQAPSQAPSQAQGEAPKAEMPKAEVGKGEAPANTAGSSTIKSLADRDPTTFTRSEIELLANLAQRRDQLEQRSRELDLRESLMAAAEKRIDERIAELKKLEASIRQTVQQYDQQEEKNLQSLVKVYENMKPKDAARIFEKLDPTVQLNVVERMKEAKVAAVLSEMDPASAQNLTVRLANRKQIPASIRASVEQASQTPAAPAGAPATAKPAPAAQPAAAPK